MKSEFDFINSFPPLDHPEHHFNKYPEHPWLKSKSDIIGWIELNLRERGNSNEYKVHEDMTVELVLGSTIRVESGEIIKLPIQLRNAVIFKMNNVKLESLIGTPYICGRLTAENNNIKSFEGVTGNLDSLMLENNSISNFVDMPNFSNKNNILVISENPIISWQGFTACNILYWWQYKWCAETSLKLLMETPININKIYLENQFNSNKIVRDETVRVWLDMEWLRNEQNKRKSIKSINNDIGNSLEFKNNENKKRKL